ncbi:MAG: sugar ABC transporter substrate-binding protein [Bacillota bacterium]
MKKAVVLFLLCMLLSTLAVAQERTLNIWAAWANEWVNIFQQLTDQHFTPATGIEVKISALPWDSFEQKFLLAAATGDVPDIGLTGGLGPADLGVRGAVVDLKARFGKEVNELSSQFFPGLMRSLTFYDAVFGMPMIYGSYNLFYRTDILTEFGLSVPDTWDEVRALIPKLQANDKNFAVAYGHQSIADFSLFLFQRDGDWYTPDLKKSALDSGESILAFTEFTELFTKYNIPKEIQPNFQPFRTGDIPMQIGATFDYANLQIAAPEIRGKWGMSMVPGTPDENGELNRSAYIGTMGIMIFEKSKDVPGAWEWIKWFMSEETQATVSNEIMTRIPGGMLFPANYNALMNINIPEEHRTVLVKQGMVGKAPAYALSPESVTKRFISNALSEVVLLNSDPEETILKAASEMTAELTRKQAEFNRFISKLKN